MGGRRLPFQEAVRFGALALAGLLLCAACRGDAPAPVDAAPTRDGVPTATATVAPPATPTPDLLGPPPADSEAATRALARFLPTAGDEFCPAALRERWKVRCAIGDLDGDGKPDRAILVPLAARAGPFAEPAIIVLKRAAAAGFELFPDRDEADPSPFGEAVFSIADRTGDGRPELGFLSRQCSQRSCSSFIHLQSWDGTAWREVGPGEPVENLDKLAVEGAGAKTVFIAHGGALKGPGAGPPRAATVTFSLDGVRYRESRRVADPPAYLFHALPDADDLFEAGKFGDAAKAYRAAVDDKALKDWRPEDGKPPGRPSLEAYALFRIAVATAAAGDDTVAALDAAITGSKEQVFVSAAEAFRRGLQERGGPPAGCREVTAYLGSPGVPERIREIFDYGYGNFPIKTYRDICPL